MVQARIDALHAADPNNTMPIPSDLVTASASGLDPDISVASALYQLHRVAQARNMSESVVQDLINANTKDRQLGVLGEKTVNVLELNLALDDLQAEGGGGSFNQSAPSPNIPTDDARVLDMMPTSWAFIVFFVVLLAAFAFLIGKLILEIYEERPGSHRGLLEESRLSSIGRQEWRSEAWIGRSMPWRCCSSMSSVYCSCWQ